MTDNPQNILVLHRQNSAVGYYRSWVRARALKRLGHEVTWWEEKTYSQNLKPKYWRALPPEERAERWLKDHLSEFDLLIVDRATNYAEARMFAGFRHFSRGMRMIVDFDDDFLNIPKWNQSTVAYQPGKEPLEASLQHFSLSELTTVSTSTLAERFRKKAHRILVVPNYIDPVDWTGLPMDPARKDDPCLRVLYGGAAGHYGDLEPIKEGLEAVIRNPPIPFRLICFGALPAWMHSLGREYPGRVVSLPWIPFKHYPQTIAWGGFDLALAPLAQHPFNEAKSSIKVQEAAIQQIPILCSDIGPYSTVPSECVTQVDNTPAQWSEALRALLTDPKIRKAQARRALDWVQAEWTIDSGLGVIQNMVEEALSRPRIETHEDTVVAS